MRWLLLVVVAVSTELAGQPLENGPRAAAVGGAGVAIGGDLAPHLNPAGVAVAGSFFFVTRYSRAYGLSELDHLFAGAGFPIRGSVIAVSIERFGFELFRQHEAHLIAARSFPSVRVTAGIAGTIRHTSVPGMKRSLDAYGSAGLTRAFGDLVTIAAAIHRIPRSISRVDEGRVIVIGAALNISGKTVFLVDACKDAHFPVSVRSGLEVTPVRQVSIRGGISTAPETVAMGIGFHVGIARIDIAVQRHSVLGWSRAGSLRVGNS